MNDSIRMYVELVENGYIAVFSKIYMSTGEIGTTYVGRCPEEIKSVAMAAFEERLDEVIKGALQKALHRDVGPR